MSNYRIISAPELVALFAALGNPHRLALFQRLATCCVPGTRCSLDAATRISLSDLGADLAIAPSTLSHHLKTLRNAGLVKTERGANGVTCWVEPAVLVALSGFFLAPLAPLDTRDADPTAADPTGPTSPTPTGARPHG